MVTTALRVYPGRSTISILDRSQTRLLQDTAQELSLGRGLISVVAAIELEAIARVAVGVLAISEHINF